MIILSGGVDDPQVLALLDLHVTRGARGDERGKRSRTGCLGTEISRDQLLGGVGGAIEPSRWKLAKAGGICLGAETAVPGA